MFRNFARQNDLKTTKNDNIIPMATTADFKNGMCLDIDGTKFFTDDMGYNFMHTETFEQVALPGESIEGVQFLKEGDICEAMVHAASDTILTCEMPTSVILEITYTEPGIKGDTATNTLKPATVETGAEVRVPLFCEVGDKVRIDTREDLYSRPRYDIMKPHLKKNAASDVYYIYHL